MINIVTTTQQLHARKLVLVQANERECRNGIVHTHTHTHTLPFSQEQHHLSLVVEVSRQLPLQLIFDTLNGAKSLGVTEYDVSQTTLNEVSGRGWC